MIKKFTFVVIIVSSIMAILLLSPIALGWFHDATVSDASVDGAIIGSYFEYGDGSEAHPFGIAQPKQLYYLAWLQDLGYFNKVDARTAGIGEPHYHNLASYKEYLKSQSEKLNKLK